MLSSIIDLVSVYQQTIINLLALMITVLLTFTSKNKNIGVLVSCYYAVYLSLELSYFGLVGDFIYLTFDKFSLWYLLCFALTLIVFITALILFIGGSDVAGLYALWLFVCLVFDGVSSILQLSETNRLLIVYNGVQNISIFVDLFVVFVGMDHIIKRNYSGAQVFIDYVNCKLEYWCTMVLLSIFKGAKCRKKKSIN